jgi:hypothetical protein
LIPGADLPLPFSQAIAGMGDSTVLKLAGLCPEKPLPTTGQIRYMMIRGGH